MLDTTVTIGTHESRADTNAKMTKSYSSELSFATGGGKIVTLRKFERVGPRHATWHRSIPSARAALNHPRNQMC
jgi:hypothetical protein